MPLAGTLCCQDGKPKSFEHCIQQAHQGGCQHSIPLLTAMSQNSKSREGITISPSTLSTCPRWQILSERNDYFESPADYYRRWLGSGTHAAISMSGPYEMVTQEQRFSRSLSVEGREYVVSGQPDWYDEQSEHLEDFKRVSYLPRAVRPDHETQLNIYAWLLEGNGLPVKSAAVRYLGNTGELVHPVALWTEDAVERYITDKYQPVARYHYHGNLSLLRVHKSDEWKAPYCPFASDHNPGRCCMSPVDENKAPSDDVPF